MGLRLEQILVIKSFVNFKEAGNSINIYSSTAHCPFSIIKTRVTLLVSEDCSFVVGEE